MEINQANRPADSPVPGIIPAAPRIEADGDSDAGAHRDAEPPPSAPTGKAHGRGPVGALLTRLLRRDG